MPVRDDLGTRMKTFYENIPKTKLMRKVPVAIRIDGKAFHTFTRGFQKPFDSILIKTMQETTKYLCENIQGCVLGYTQSDEITLILIDYKKLTSCAWFDYEVQKICSVAASMATMAFNKFFYQNAIVNYASIAKMDTPDYCAVLEKAAEKGAMFDARCFNIPKEEVTNLIYWRQLDAARNSVQMVGQANFSHNELQDKTCSNIQDMLMLQKGINWNDFPTYQKRGAAVVKNKVVVDRGEFTESYFLRDPSLPESAWVVDLDMPILKNEARQYVDTLIGVV